MTRARQKSPTGKIFDNILFLAEVFGDQADQDIPKMPVLEMAQCFDLQVPRVSPPSRRRQQSLGVMEMNVVEVSGQRHSRLGHHQPVRQSSKQRAAAG